MLGFEKIKLNSKRDKSTKLLISIAIATKHHAHEETPGSGQHDDSGDEQVPKNEQSGSSLRDAPTHESPHNRSPLAAPSSGAN